MIGVDLAKRVFQLHGASMAGHVKFRKKLTREQFRRFMSDQPSCVVVFEACSSASYWAGHCQDRTRRFLGLIRSVSAACATAGAAQGEKRLSSRRFLAIFMSDGTPLGECQHK